MAVIVVGGHSRSVGKTSVAAGLIAAMPQLGWTAVKITQFGHGVCSHSGEPCDCDLGDTDHAWSLDEEHDRSGQSDSSRFLVAGAARSYWLRTRQGHLAEAMPALRELLGKSEHVMIESNSILRFLRPDVYLTVLDPATADFKPSARAYLDRADAMVLHTHGDAAAHAWQNVSLKPAREKPMFRISPPQYVTEELVEFVARRICAAEDPPRLTGTTG